MALYRVYAFGQFRLVTRHRMLYGEDGSKSRITGKPFDLLVYLLDHAGEEIKKDFLLKGTWCDGVKLSDAALTKHFVKLYAFLNDTDRDNPVYIQRDDRSTWFRKVPQVTEEEEQPERPPVQSGAPQPSATTHFSDTPQLVGEREESSSHGLASVPTLPANFIPRPVELALLRNAVLEPTHGPCIALTAYEGMGGIGKTILAQALCHDAAVRQAFPNGIAWITLGKEYSPDDLIRKIRLMGKDIGADLSRCENIVDCGSQFKKALRDKVALVVVDDVWNAHDLEPFLADAPVRAYCSQRGIEVLRPT